ncbi:hypothetical protein HG531_005023 [Fusarium graminearum]|nr:hypothetical protein HG531_005023 [Fusarium graminearum]
MQTQKRKDIPGTKPKQHHRVKSINLGDQDDGRHKEEKPVAKNEIGREHGKFGDLAKELTSRLRDCVPSHRVPLSAPEGDVRRVALELTSETGRNNKLHKEALNRDHGDHTRYSAGEVKALQNEHAQEGNKKEDHSCGMGNSCENTAKLLATHTEERSHTASHAEHSSQDTCIDGNRRKSDDE